MSDNERTLNQVYDEFSSVGSLKENFYDWHGLNETLFFAINGFHQAWYDKAMLLVTEIGNHKLFLYYLAFFAFYALVSTLSRKLAKRSGLKTHINMWFGVITVMLLGYASMGITVKVIKSELAYPRPYEVYDTQKITVLQPQPPGKARQSFPSGHSAFIAFLLTALWPVLNTGFKGLFVLLAFGVAWSRIGLGVHFPADVVGGLTFGFIITLFVRVVLYSLYRKLFRLNC